MVMGGDCGRLFDSVKGAENLTETDGERLVKVQASGMESKQTALSRVSVNWTLVCDQRGSKHEGGETDESIYLIPCRRASIA